MKRLNTPLTMGRRMALSFGAMVLLLMSIAAAGLIQLGRIGHTMTQVVDVYGVQASLANQMLHHINAMSLGVRTIGLLIDVKEITKEVQQLERSTADYRAAEAQLVQSVQSAAGADLAEDQKLLADIHAAAEKAVPYLLEAAKAGAEGDSLLANTIVAEKLIPSETQWRTLVNELVSASQQRNQLASAEASQAQSQARSMILIVGALAVILAVVVGRRLTVAITRPIARAINLSEKVASGDLSSDIETTDGQDEASRLISALSRMQESLSTTMALVQSSSGSIDVASGEIAAGNFDLSVRTEQTAANLQRAASSMDQLGLSVRQTADSARTAEALASSATEVAQKGGHVVSDVVSTMNDIHSSSKKIAEIIAVIDGIAFQTNILALNAAVEAARAGEQGRGFSVVAAEVRQLAQRSANAAKEIRGLIQASVERVESGTALVGTAGSTMQEIVSAVQQLSTIVQEIAASASGQTSELDHINHTVTQLDQMTQQNAALVEQSAAAAQSLKDQTQCMDAAIRAFRLKEAAPDGAYMAFEA